MKLIKRKLSKYFIPSNMFGVCLIDQITRKDILNQYPSRRNGAYYLDKFINYLTDAHQLDIIDYCEQYLNLRWPNCLNCDKKVNCKVRGSGLILNRIHRGSCMNKKTCPAFSQACKKLSEQRKGKGNPMFQKPAWNRGLGVEDFRIKAIADKRRGSKANEETKAKMRKIRAESPIKARHTTPHSLSSISKMRVATAKRYQDGLFKRETSIHIKMREFLNSLSLVENIKEEYFAKFFSLDFAFPENKIAIECQGTYFHVDPRIYPDGPINAIQRRNFGRDEAKNKILKKQGWKIIPVWETEINDDSFKIDLLCELKKLNLLN